MAEKIVTRTSLKSCPPRPRPRLVDPKGPARVYCHTHVESGPQQRPPRRSAVVIRPQFNPPSLPPPRPIVPHPWRTQPWIGVGRGLQFPGADGPEPLNPDLRGSIETARARLMAKTPLPVQKAEVSEYVFLFFPTTTCPELEEGSARSRVVSGRKEATATKAKGPGTHIKVPLSSGAAAQSFPRARLQREARPPTVACGASSPRLTRLASQHTRDHMSCNLKISEKAGAASGVVLLVSRKSAGGGNLWDASARELALPQRTCQAGGDAGGESPGATHPNGGQFRANVPWANFRPAETPTWIGILLPTHQAALGQTQLECPHREQSDQRLAAGQISRLGAQDLRELGPEHGQARRRCGRAQHRGHHQRAQVLLEMEDHQPQEAQERRREEHVRLGELVFSMGSAKPKLRTRTMTCGEAARPRRRRP